MPNGARRFREASPPRRSIGTDRHSGGCKGRLRPALCHLHYARNVPRGSVGAISARPGERCPGASSFAERAQVQPAAKRVTIAGSIVSRSSARSDAMVRAKRGQSASAMR